MPVTDRRITWWSAKLYWSMAWNSGSRMMEKMPVSGSDHQNIINAGQSTGYGKVFKCFTGGFD